MFPGVAVGPSVTYQITGCSKQTLRNLRSATCGTTQHIVALGRDSPPGSGLKFQTISLLSTYLLKILKYSIYIFLIVYFFTEVIWFNSLLSKNNVSDMNKSITI